jgi:hypothetical protein
MGRRIERKRCFLIVQQQKNRLEFAKNHIHWTLKDWRRIAFTDEMGMQTDSNQERVYVWRYPEEEFHKDCIKGIVLSGFQKVKIWGAMRYGKLSKLVCMPEGKTEGKMMTQKYLDLIMDEEMFDFWLEGMEEVGNLLMMEDDAPYHKGVASKRRAQLEEDGWIVAWYGYGREKDEYLYEIYKSYGRLRHMTDWLGTRNLAIQFS